MVTQKLSSITDNYANTQGPAVNCLAYRSKAFLKLNVSAMSSAAFFASIALKRVKFLALKLQYEIEHFLNPLTS